MTEQLVNVPQPKSGEFSNNTTDNCDSSFSKVPFSSSKIQIHIHDMFFRTSFSIEQESNHEHV